MDEVQMHEKFSIEGEGREIEEYKDYIACVWNRRKKKIGEDKIGFSRQH